jgi:phosphate transport system substrate-binding protein
MPTTGRCTNIGNCDKADKKELITVPDGADLVCPECDKPLLVIGSAGAGGGGMVKMAAGAVAVFLVAVVWFLWPRPESPTPPTPTSSPGQKLPPAASLPPPVQTRNVILRIHGSNTIGSQLVPELAKAFLEEKGASRIEQVPGGKEQESFMQGDLNGDTVPEAIEIHAHGSKTAFDDLKAGLCDIGMSSRKIKDEEGRDLLPLLGDLTSNASEHTVALDGLAVIVHPANPVSALTMEQVAAVFAGEVTDWSQVGGAPAPITLYARDDKSGTFEFFKNNVLEKYRRTLSPAAQRIEDSGELSSRVAGDVNGIGFIAMPYVKTNKAIALSDRGTHPLRPNERTVKTEDYPLTRRLYLYTPASPKNRYTTEFIAFATNHAPGTKAHTIVDAVAFVNLDPTPVANATSDTSDPRNVSAEWRRLTSGASEFLTRFRFRSGRAELDTRAQRDIGRIVGILSYPDYKNARILLIGFADSSGSPTANKELSLERARIVERELRTEGLRIEQVAGLGAEAPIAPNDDLEGREKNRRVEIWVRK